MPRIDDYISARKIAVEQLSKELFDVLSERSGFEPEDGNTFRIPFLNRIYRVHYPDFEFEDRSEVGKEIPIQEGDAGYKVNLRDWKWAALGYPMD